MASLPVALSAGSRVRVSFSALSDVLKMTYAQEDAQPAVPGREESLYYLYPELSASAGTGTGRVNGEQEESGDHYGSACDF